MRLILFLVVLRKFVYVLVAININVVWKLLFSYENETKNFSKEKYLLAQFFLSGDKKSNYHKTAI